MHVQDGRNRRRRCDFQVPSERETPPPGKTESRALAYTYTYSCTPVCAASVECSSGRGAKVSSTPRMGRTRRGGGGGGGGGRERGTDGRTRERVARSRKGTRSSSSPVKPIARPLAAAGCAAAGNRPRESVGRRSCTSRNRLRGSHTLGQLGSSGKSPRGIAAHTAPPGWRASWASSSSSSRTRTSSTSRDTFCPAACSSSSTTRPSKSLHDSFHLLCPYVGLPSVHHGSLSLSTMFSCAQPRIACVNTARACGQLRCWENTFSPCCVDFLSRALAFVSFLPDGFAEDRPLRYGQRSVALASSARS